MNSDFELAFRHILKTVIHEVTVELIKARWISEQPQPQKQTQADNVMLLRSREAAQRLAISEKHLNNLTRSGSLPCVRVGQCVRYSVETIQQWIRESESIEVPHAPSVTTHEEQTTSPTPSKVMSKATPKLAAKRNPDIKTAPSIRSKKVKQLASTTLSGSKQAESEDRSNPFSDLLNELGVSRNSLPPLTNGELRRIAEVDMATLHSWMYHSRELPDAAMNKLREHFRAYLDDRKHVNDAE